MEPSLLSAKQEVRIRASAVECQPFSICRRTVLLCNLHIEWVEVNTTQDLISRAAHQGSSTLSSMWTMTRNEPELEALSPTGLASTELIVTVLTMPSTGKHSLTEPPSSLNPAILAHLAVGMHVPFSGRSLLGSTPGAGSTPFARESWSRTGHGTGLPWTTSSSIVQRPNCDSPTNSQYNVLSDLRCSHSGFAGSWALLLYSLHVFS